MYGYRVSLLTNITLQSITLLIPLELKHYITYPHSWWRTHHPHGASPAIRWSSPMPTHFTIIIIVPPSASSSMGRESPTSGTSSEWGEATGGRETPGWEACWGTIAIVVIVIIVVIIPVSSVRGTPGREQV